MLQALRIASSKVLCCACKSDLTGRTPTFYVQTKRPSSMTKLMKALKVEYKGATKCFVAIVGQSFSDLARLMCAIFGIPCVTEFGDTMCLVASCQKTLAIRSIEDIFCSTLCDYSLEFRGSQPPIQSNSHSNLLEVILCLEVWLCSVIYHITTFNSVPNRGVAGIPLRAKLSITGLYAMGVALTQFEVG